MGRSNLASSASVFAALGDEQRLRIVARLADEGPLSIARLTERIARRTTVSA